MHKSWRFALPPGVIEGPPQAAQVRTALSTIGCAEARHALTYGLLLDELVEGVIHAAWAPPLVCAKLEQLGGRVILRAVRGGSGTYRSVLFARADRHLTLETLQGTTAAWLDQRSMSGYVLPRAHLRALGFPPETTFSREKFLGSYGACVHAVLDRKVDVSSTFASSATASTQRLGYVDCAPQHALELAPMGFSADCPHDGIVLSPKVAADDARVFAKAFQDLMGDAAPAKTLCDTLQVDGFEVPPPGSYARMAQQFAAETPDLHL